MQSHESTQQLLIHGLSCPRRKVNDGVRAVVLVVLLVRLLSHQPSQHLEHAKIYEQSKQSNLFNHLFSVAFNLIVKNYYSFFYLYGFNTFN
jgi:hypothetical protein